MWTCGRGSGCSLTCLDNITWVGLLRVIFYYSSTRYFLFSVAIFHFRYQLLQSIDELLEFMETWGFVILTLDRHLSHCCACHFDGHHLPDNPSLWSLINFVLLLLLLLFATCQPGNRSEYIHIERVLVQGPDPLGPR